MERPDEILDPLAGYFATGSRSTQAWLHSLGMMPGDALFLQFLMRDPGFPAPDGIGMSDALAFTLQQ